MVALSDNPLMCLEELLNHRNDPKHLDGHDPLKKMNAHALEIVIDDGKNGEDFSKTLHQRLNHRWDLAHDYSLLNLTLKIVFVRYRVLRVLLVKCLDTLKLSRKPNLNSMPSLTSLRRESAI